MTLQATTPLQAAGILFLACLCQITTACIDRYNWVSHVHGICHNPACLPYPILTYTALYCPALSYPILSYPTLSCPTLSCPALSFPNPACHILPCPILSYPALPYPFLTLPALSCPAFPCPILSCPVLPYPALSYPVLPYPALSYPALSCPILILSEVFIQSKSVFNSNLLFKTISCSNRCFTTRTRTRTNNGVFYKFFIVQCGWLTATNNVTGLDRYNRMEWNG